MRVKAHHSGLTSLDKFSKLCTVNTLCFLNLEAQKVYQVNIAFFPLTPDIVLFPNFFIINTLKLQLNGCIKDFFF